MGIITRMGISMYMAHNRITRMGISMYLAHNRINHIILGMDSRIKHRIRCMGISKGMPIHCTQHLQTTCNSRCWLIFKIRINKFNVFNIISMMCFKP